MSTGDRGHLGSEPMGQGYASTNPRKQGSFQVLWEISVPIWSGSGPHNSPGGHMVSQPEKRDFLVAFETLCLIWLMNLPPQAKVN